MVCDAATLAEVMLRPVRTLIPETGRRDALSPCPAGTARACYGATDAGPDVPAASPGQATSRRGDRRVVPRNRPEISVTK